MNSAATMPPAVLPSRGAKGKGPSAPRGERGPRGQGPNVGRGVGPGPQGQGPNVPRGQGPLDAIDMVQLGNDGMAGANAAMAKAHDLFRFASMIRGGYRVFILALIALTAYSWYGLVDDAPFITGSAIVMIGILLVWARKSTWMVVMRLSPLDRSLLACSIPQTATQYEIMLLLTNDWKGNTHPPSFVNLWGFRHLF